MAIRQINFKFDEGAVVKFKTDDENIPFIVTGYLVHGKEVMYELSCSGSPKSYHYEYEIELVDE